MDSLADELQLIQEPVAQEPVAQEPVAQEPVAQEESQTENVEEEDQLEGTLTESNRIEESLTSGIDIAKSGPLSAPSDDEEIIELGDLIEINSEKYKKVKGRVYYRDLDLIKIMPDGVSDRVYSFPIVPDETNVSAGTFDPELGITEISIYEKRRLVTFVEEHNLRAGFNLETFKNGIEGPTYKITKVSIDNDSIEIMNEESGEPISVEFNGVGIPLDADFDVVRMREPVEEMGINVEGAQVIEKSEVDEDIEEIGEVDEDGFERVDIELTGFTEVAAIQEVAELGEILRRYPEALQKSDLLTDLMTFLDPISQKDNNKLRMVRLLVEQYALLKKSILRINQQGQPGGIDAASLMTMKDLIKKHVPLMRPVLAVTKKAYLTEPDMTSPTEMEFNASQLKLVNFTDDLAAMAKGPAPEAMTDFYNSFRNYLDTYSTLIFDKDKPRFTAKADQEIFRASLDEKVNTIGFIQPKKDVFVPYVKEIDIALDRILGTTYRPDLDGPNKVFMPAEESTLKEALLFPLETAPSMGANKTGSLFEDIVRSMTKMMLVKDIIEKYKDSDDITKSIYTIEERPVGFDDYLRKQPIIGFGPGDFQEALVDYGLRDNEINLKQLEVFEEKMRSSVSQLIEYLKDMRLQMKEMVSASPQRFFDTDIDKEIPENEPILEKILAEFKKTNPNLYQTDIGRISELIRQQRDLYIAVVGGDPATIAKERVKAVRRGYVDALIRSQKMKEKRTSGGEAPVPNKCEHVKALRAIRSIKDSQEQVIVMLRFLSRYQGDSDEHITNCIICKKFLVCKHEILQLQQAIHPRKEEVIAKQLHLDFAGGSFGKYYICKICGQPFSEIGYDTHIEFDDEGRPMMGRSVIEKEEEPITIQEIDDILGVQEEGKEEYDEKFASPLQDELAKITRKISSKVGIYVDRISMEWIVSSAETSILSEYSQEEYLKKQETMKAIAKKKGVPAPEELDYQIFISRMTIAYTTAYLLIDIQTKMPNYQVTSIMPGCIPGFSGVPLDSQEDQTGIQYISCAVASIMDKFAPWNKTSYQRQSNYSKRQKIISQYMMGAMKKILLNANVISRLADKRDYLLKQYGIKDGRHAESIPALLKPTQLQIEAVDIIEPPTDGVSGWILTAHKVARESGILLKGSPFVEANCCINQVNKPTEFWDSKDMPPLEDRKMKEFRATSIVTQDMPRDIAVILADAPEDFYYRLFLKVCFKGENEGYPHEVGFDNVCSWCGFVFPEHPSTLDPDTKGREAIENQPEKVEINSQTFQNLLDAVHRNYSVDAYRPPSLMSAEDRLLEFVRLDPSPMEEWAELLTNIHTQFVEFSKAKIVPNNLQVGTILGPISELALANATKVKSKIGTAASSILDSISVMPADEFTEVINAYFITPFMRLITNTSPDIYKKAIKGTKLSYMHVEDLRNDINSQMDYLNKYANKLSAADFTKKKIQYAVEQFSSFMKLKSVFRSMLMPGFQLTTEYIQKGLLFGILNTLFNSTIIPPNAEGLTMSDAITDNSATLLLECIRTILLRFSHEKLSYSLEKIRADIAMSAEMEKVNMIKNYFDKMTDEEKEVALTMKRLGMGRFGSERANAVWKYNASRYDIEKMDRAEMGVSDFRPFESGAAAVDFASGMDAGVDYGVGNDFLQEGSDDF